MDRLFLVCSYGGSGTSMLTRKLVKYGTARPIHSLPPAKLEGYRDCVFSGEELSEEELNKTTVIYIYKNPVNAVYSRYNKEHFRRYLRFENSFDDLVEQKRDVFNLEKFFDAWTDPSTERNYKVICVKYDEIFEKEEELCKVLGIGKLGLVKRETKREMPHRDIVEKVYEKLNQKIEAMPFIKVV